MCIVPIFRIAALKLCAYSFEGTWPQYRGARAYRIIKLSRQSRPHAKPQSIICSAQQTIIRRRAERSVCEVIAVIAILNIGEGYDMVAKGGRRLCWSGWHPLSLHARHESDAINRQFLSQFNSSLITDSG